MMDCISFAGLILAVFAAGVAVGKLVEKVERLIRKSENQEHKKAQKNNRQ